MEERVPTSPGALGGSWNLSRLDLAINGSYPGMQEHIVSAIVVPVIFFVIFLLGIVGNSLVILVLVRIKFGKSHSITNVFVLTLSVADLTFLFFCVPSEATYYFLPDWVFGAFLCKGVPYVFTASMLVSIFTLVAMSVDRYIAIVHARRAAAVRSVRRALGAVSALWLLSLVLAVPRAHYHTIVVYKEHGNFCWEVWSHKNLKSTYRAVIFSLGYLLPLVLISACYARVGSTVFTCRDSAELVDETKQSVRQTAKTVLVLVVVFLVSWLPHHVILLWVEFGSFPLTNASFAFRIVAHCLSYGNSCVNPFIYGFLSQNFREAYRQLLRC
uniref:Galanin receptor 1a n=1 Tax=Petromyzon marinus TaxID=7757 RepID=S4RW76_PETMA